MSQTFNIYCERTGPGLWTEPLNAVTNGAFLLVAILAALEWRKRPPDALVGVLILLTAAISVGSFLFHTAATRWAMLADSIPIGLFVFLYFFLALRRFLGWSMVLVLVGLALFAAASAVVIPLLEVLFGGSAGYLPPLIALLGFGALLVGEGDPRGAAMVAAGGIFAASLAFRVLDASVCASFPLGTHFLWHLLNAAVLAVLLRAALVSDPDIRHPRPRESD
ncbi:hypothetical protein [Amorphus sp. 3PC139-8]|uniref:ceramidase domain-containing protein n=1 Tax=Amorphus sp. 3PC139-8 TaxID=2735676 RepID=UPI00345DFC55